MHSDNYTSRRQFLSRSAVIGTAGALLGSGTVFAQGAEDAAAPTPSTVGSMPKINRVGAVSYGFQYSIGLFSYQQRPGPRMDAEAFVEATRACGGSVAQLYFSMIQSLDDAGLQKLRRRAADLDVMLEVHGGVAFAPQFERTMQQAAALGAKVVGTSFGFLTRPRLINTVEAWDAHVAKCKSRLRELADKARPLGVVVAVENHLDFGVEELRDLIVEVNSPQARILFDVGNTIGTLDDPLEAADIFGPYVAATHYKDFAIEEVTRGFRFTMVPLGAGSVQLPEVTARLLKHVSPEIGFSIEMMNGQQFEVGWLEDGFWSAYRAKPARGLAATLRHIRGKTIDIEEFKPQDEIDKLPDDAHRKLESDRMAACIAYLEGLLRGIAGAQ
ncbi:MAG: sugar phosphate isomerase/epimerase family protein [Planctomycetota bacterium]